MSIGRTRLISTWYGGVKNGDQTNKYCVIVRVKIRQLGNIYIKQLIYKPISGGSMNIFRSNGDVGKRSFSNEARSAERKRETESSAACVLGKIFQQTRNKIP